MRRDSFGLLDTPPEEASRLLALRFLAEAGEARDRLRAGDDPEALHDFRVGLRRLRSTLRAYRPFLKGAAGRKLRGELRDLAAETNPGRDAEVQLEWLQKQRPLLTPRQRPGHAWLCSRLERRRDEAYGHVSERILREFEGLAARLEKRLSVYGTKVHVGRPAETERFGAVAATLLQEQSAALSALLAEVSGPEDEERAHAARIAAKRLRYLLEPLSAEAERCRPLVKQLKGLQDLLGDLHDAHVLSAEIARELEVAAAEKARRLHDIHLGEFEREARLRAELRRDERSGLLALARLVHERRNELFADLRGRWLGGRSEEFFRAVAEAAAEIGAEAGVEIERKYLLSALPEAASQAPAVEIEQGWLPGKRLQERIRRLSSADGERFYRTVKAGTGVKRVELEEETSREVFDALWPLTEGKRVHKRRFTLPAGARKWEVDQFLDRELLLAEIELQREDEEVGFPEWLAPLVVREVTGDPQYVNVNLAR